MTLRLSIYAATVFLILALAVPAAGRSIARPDTVMFIADDLDGRPFLPVLAGATGMPRVSAAPR